ncbi:putative nucleic acid binding domain protein [Mycobacterium ulcerans str. Harvey]|uniref:Nucleic acid binding domain protein n=1 Tax=Mycobacterium ulcerans str. Harvey TaxID=1299332 RepID=A0ABP3A460_MYCUL|nr:putative nucleic acid binding domain protein [Mycobacterium ulcerans str. Harvey]
MRSWAILDDPCTPELMYKMVDRIATDLDDLVEWLANPASPQPSTNPRRIASPEEALMLWAQQQRSSRRQRCPRVTAQCASSPTLRLSAPTPSPPP